MDVEYLCGLVKSEVWLLLDVEDGVEVLASLEVYAKVLRATGQDLNADDIEALYAKLVGRARYQTVHVEAGGR
jgi:hypothetical protein